MSPELQKALDALAAAYAETGEKQAEQIKSLRTELDALNDEKEGELLADAKDKLQALEDSLKDDGKPDSKNKATNHSVAPAVITDTGHWKFDNFSIEEVDVTLTLLRSGNGTNNPAHRPASDSLVKALGMRLEASEGKDTPEARAEFTKAYGPLAIKSNEISQSTLATSGDEWVGIAYSSAIWKVVRNPATIVGKIPSFEFPPNVESVVDPLESTDPTFYKVAQAADLSSNPGGIPTNVVTASTLGTANATHTLAKFGSRQLWTGELSEDAVLPFAQQLIDQIGMSASEHIESAVIDGDSATGGSANVNDIAGTPGGTEYWLNFDGFRKLALVTNTANSRDGGAITSADFIETIKLMGDGGRQAMDRNVVEFIIPNEVHWKVLLLSDVKTRDVFSVATIENGVLNNIFGYRVNVSAFMHKPAAGLDAANRYLTNTSGKIDVDTSGNNTVSSMLAVRFPSWRMGFRRRLTLETTRIPAADATEIVALIRSSLKNRDNEASAISYNLTVA